MEFFINNLHTVVLFPMWTFLLVVLGRFFNVVQSRRLIALLTLVSTLYGAVFSIGSLLYFVKAPDYVYENTYSFLRIKDLSFDFGIFADNLSILMLVVVTTISFLVQLYSANYMYKDKSFPRFFGYLNLFNFSMIGLVLSPNLFQNYVFWELVGISSYLLIGFWYKKPSASAAARKAFLMNRIGDFGLLTGTIAVSFVLYQYSGFASLATVPFDRISDVGNYLFSYTNDTVFALICVLLLFGSIAKSAQFPLHTWLADAMEGPTPVSALIHSATMVAAGVYLIARLYPIYETSEFVMNFIAVIGLVTALLCAYIAMTQNDLKRILAYSTNSQLGLMFLALGSGAYAGGIYHLVTHAYFKSMLFLCVGIVIHSILGQQDIRFMGGLRKHMPIAAICTLIGCVSISGLFFSGFYSKEMILTYLVQNNHYLYSIGFLLVSLMTAFYMFRLYFRVFEGEYRGENIPHKPHFILNFSVLILALATALIGMLSHGSIQEYLAWANTFVQCQKCVNPLFISISVAVLGVLTAFVFYNTKVRPIKIPLFYQLSNNKFYIDDFYNFLSKKVYYIITRTSAITDKYVVDGFVNFMVLVTRSISWIFSKMQTGNFQSYLAYSVVFLALIFTSLMLAYSLILQYGLLSGG